MNVNKSFNLDREYYSEECTICYNYLGEDNIALLECGHKYHKKCILNWSRLKKNNPNNFISCCICNKETNIINVEKIHIISKKKKYLCCNII